MKNIDHLPPTEREHFMQCPDCRAWFDMRDLNAVFSHEHGMPPMPTVSFSHAEKRPLPFFTRLTPLVFN